ncbi:MAG: hypothetical protein OMM_10205, partial [Candidatus Magnetoglobus multicellularis str. Araruama]
NQIQKNINNALSDLNKIDLDNLSPDQIKKAFGKAAEKKAVDKILELSKIADIDIVEQIEIFLKTKRSESTKSTYKNGLNKYLEYCYENNINPLLINSQQADLFGAYCRDSFNKNSADIYISSVSSFYSWMQKT